MLNGLLKKNLDMRSSAWSSIPERQVLTVADLRPGESARITRVQGVRVGRGERLMAYGLVPGQMVTLVQNSPAFVIRVEETELALDRAVAACIEIAR